MWLRGTSYVGVDRLREYLDNVSFGDQRQNNRARAEIEKHESKQEIPYHDERNEEQYQQVRICSNDNCAADKESARHTIIKQNAQTSTEMRGTMNS